MDCSLPGSSVRGFFPRQKYWSGSHFLLQGIFLTQGSNRISCCCCSVAHHVQLIVTRWTAACQVSLSFTISQSFLKLMSTELVIPFNHLILCCPLLLPSIFLASGSFPMSQLFASGGQSIGASTSVTNEYSNEYSRLISFRIDQLDLHPVQGTLKSLLQHHSSKASVQHSACFIVQLSYLYMTTEKNTALTIWIFVSKVMSLLFNMMSTFVIAFLPRSKHPLISWLQLLSTVILEPKKIKVCHCFHFYPIYLP